ncbi:Tm-1-like ATP-binding domain-containing protein [uncultured Leifsonia sp.]|uniref:Tm-1-like ATP-binding domain-containing protein n=1 Tax=uncultured Leifsonia sp. TaxID=340359 RepID=UPI0028D6E39A|nr:Tm-1-like ATP-binding domain-containing protein [uncultured Leifsonia sp.]
MSTAVLIGTLDTKGREYAFVRDQLRAAGADVVVIDVGVLGLPEFEPDISAVEVAEAAGERISNLRFGREGSDTRAVALEAMRRGAVEVVEELRREGRCDGVLGMGGSGGSALISAVLRTLPLGVPKVLVSTMASGDISPYVGSSDMCVFHSVTDIAGLNRISRPVLANAAHALAGMINAPHQYDDEARPAVALTMLGVTTPCVLHVAERLEQAGYDPVVFHAVGSGGRALEQLTGQGVFAAVLDLTVKELTDAEFGGVFNAGDSRMRTAGRLGLPQVIVPGAIEVLNFGAYNTVPQRYVDEGRPIVRHNAEVTAVRLSDDELTRMAETLAERVNAAAGPISVIIPARGFDSYDHVDGPFADPAGDAAFIHQFTKRLSNPATVLDLDINDVAFADAVADAFLRLMYTAPVHEGATA